MMKLSTRSSYGLRAALALALQFGEPPVTVASLAEDNGIPRRYLEQILNRLRRKGLVEATRGPRGGYRLALSPDVVSVGAIVRAVEGDLQPVLCTFPEKRSAECRTSAGCVSRSFCNEMERSMTRILDGTSLGDLSRRARGGERSLEAPPVPVGAS